MNYVVHVEPKPIKQIESSFIHFSMAVNQPKHQWSFPSFTIEKLLILLTLCGPDTKQLPYLVVEQLAYKAVDLQISSPLDNSHVASHNVMQSLSNISIIFILFHPLTWVC